MDIPVIIQARTSSSRLPGKVLMPLRGRPMLQLLLDRLAPCGLDLAVATSVEPGDDAVAGLCADLGVTCVRGPLADVAGRFALAVEELGCPAFVRICGDSPLMDPGLVGQVVDLFLKTSPDLATNIFPRTFPGGQSVEVVDAGAFFRARRSMASPEEMEHVTKYFYNHSGHFNIQNLESGEDWGDVHLCVDTVDDYRLVKRVVDGLDRPLSGQGWRELAGLARELREGGSC